MPPKKAKGAKGAKGGKGSKKSGKKDAKKEVPKKLTKKDKKLIKKFGELKFEGADGKEESLIWMKRDELEVVAETLREQTSLTRKERIKFMLERDFLYDSMKAYQDKLDCLLEEERLRAAEELKATQDVAELATVKNMEEKHFRYEVQLNATQMDMRNELRRQKLKDWLDRSWQSTFRELEKQSALFDDLSITNSEKIEEARKSLDNLHEYAADQENQMREYTLNLNKAMQDSIYVFRMQRNLELQDFEERYNEFLWNLKKNYERSHDQYKQFYIIACHHCLTYILSMKDDLTEVEARKNIVRETMKKMKTDLKTARAIFKTVNDLFHIAKVKHHHFENLKRSISCTSQEILRVEKEISRYLQEYRHLSHHMTAIDEERIHFRATTDQMADNLVHVYNDRYRITQASVSLNQDRCKWENEKARLVSKIANPNDFPAAVAPYMLQINSKDVRIERQKLRALRISKQQDDMRNSLEARMLSIGLKTKYKTVLPQQSHVAVRSQRLDWGPAGLLANKQFKIRPVRIPRKPRCVIPEETEDLVQVCITESIEKALDLRHTKSTTNK